MKKFLLFFLLYTSLLFSQSGRVNYNINDLFNCSLPSVPEIGESRGIKVISSPSDKFNIRIFILPSAQVAEVKIENRDQLLEFYNGVIEGQTGKDKGEVISSTFIKLSSLDAVSYAIKFKRDEEVFILYTYAVYVNNSLYSFQFLEHAADDPLLAGERNIFYGSITPAAQLTPAAQYTGEGKSTAYQLGLFVGETIIPLAIAGFVIYYLWRKNKKSKILTK